MTHALKEILFGDGERTCRADLPTGTKEWADSNVNVLYGCGNDCRYCYAKKMALRFGRETDESWPHMRVNHKAVEKGYQKRQGRVMFPTTHDLFDAPKFLEPCLTVLGKLLESGNEVLLTTKPRLGVTKRVCEQFDHYRPNIQFRFTIGSKDDGTLQFWEPNAPSFIERLESLKLANKRGFKTSVSIEPFLDDRPEELVELLSPFVTESIWIGKMNYIQRKGLAPCEREEYERARLISSRKNIARIVKCLNDHPLIRWKDSILKMFLSGKPNRKTRRE